MSVPTQSLLFTWLKREHNINTKISHGYNFTIVDVLNTGIFIHIKDIDNMFHYEMTLEEALWKIIENLL